MSSKEILHKADVQAVIAEAIKNDHAAYMSGVYGTLTIDDPPAPSPTYSQLEAQETKIAIDAILVALKSAVIVT